LTEAFTQDKSAVRRHFVGDPLEHGPNAAAAVVGLSSVHDHESSDLFELLPGVIRAVNFFRAKQRSFGLKERLVVSSGF
jgi:hypothetical protein